MSDLDALLARSQDPGQFVERRTFTLSRDKALEKMRQFSLRHPDRYALEIVQAAVFMGARWMFVDADRYGLTVGWVGGRRISTTQLDGLFDYLFVSESTRETRHLRQLAVALNVLLQRRPHVLRLESGDETGSARLDLDADGSGTVGIPKDPLAGTYVHVQFAERGWFSRFRSRRLPLAAQLIETECMYSPSSIYVNGNGPFGWDPYSPLESMFYARQERFKADGRDGWLGVGDPYGKNEITLVIGGVRVSQRAIPEFGLGITGVIRDDSLVKTADMGDVVQDANYNRMLHALQPVAQRLTGEELMELEPLVEEVEEVEEDEEAPIVPVAKGVVAVGRVGRVPIQELNLHPQVFWIRPDQVADLEEQLAPDRFDEKVIVLHPSQVPEVLASTRGVKLFHIDTEDASFVVEQAAKRTCAVLEVSGKSYTLFIRLHEAGGLPGWRRPEGTPLLVIHKGRTVHIAGAPLRAPGVSMVMEVDAWEPERAEALAIEAGRALYANVWQFIEDPASADEVRRSLVLAVLPFLLRVLPEEDGSPQIGLARNLPPEADRLFDVPLAEDVSLRKLMGVLGTDEVLELSEPVSAAKLADLTALLGVGHLHHPEMDPLFVFEARFDGERWVTADGPAVSDDVVALVRVCPSYRSTPPAGFVTYGTPGPLLMAAVRPDQPVFWDAGWAHLRTLVDQTAGNDALEPWRRLASIALSEREAVLTASNGKPVPAEGLYDGSLRVAYRAGPDLAEADTVLLTVDEARWLAELGPLRWRFDDAPEVWARAPTTADWLVTVDVQTPDLQGWMGLRLPYDPTGSVWVRSGFRTEVASELDHAVRCHGWIEESPDPEHDRVNALHGAAMSLLEALASRLESDLEGPALAAAQRYAADFVWMGQRDRSIPQDLVTRLGRAVSVRDGSDTVWGDFGLWLRTHPTIRPRLGFQVHGFRGEAVDVDVAPAETALVQATAAEDVIQHAVHRMGLDIDLSVVVAQSAHEITAWGTETIYIQLGAGDVQVSMALAGNREALGRVLLRVAHAVYVAEQRQGVERDFLAMQRAVLRALE